MVPDISPVIWLTNDPSPPPFNVLLFEIVGEGDVLQQTPRSMIGPPLSVVISPPDFAMFGVISVTGFSVITGNTTGTALLVQAARLKTNIVQMDKGLLFLYHFKI